MLDTTKYEYIELEMPNILLRWDIGRSKDNVTFCTDRDIKNFLLEAAVKFPMWKFVGVGISRRDGPNGTMLCGGYRFHVYEDREFVGVVGSTYTRQGTAYTLSNDRIANARERGSEAKTRNIDKALKIMSKQFGTKTINERLLEAKEACAAFIFHAQNDKGRVFRDNYRKLTDKLMTHLMTNWDLTLEVATHSGVDATVLEALPRQFEDCLITDKVQKCFDNKEGAVVTIHGNDYAVNGKDCVTICGTDDLPEWVKRGVGMLKLVEPGQIIANVGVRVNEQSFFVLEGK